MEQPRRFSCVYSADKVSAFLAMHSLERESGASGVGHNRCSPRRRRNGSTATFTWNQIGWSYLPKRDADSTPSNSRRQQSGAVSAFTLLVCWCCGSLKVSVASDAHVLQVDTSDLGSEEVSFPVSLPPLSLPLMASALTHYYRDSSPRSTQSTQHHSDALRRPLRHSPHTAAVVGLVGLAADADESPVVVVGRQWCVRKPPRHRCQHAMSSRPPGSHQKRAHAHTRSGRCGWPFTH